MEGGVGACPGEVGAGEGRAVGGGAGTSFSEMDRKGGEARRRDHVHLGSVRVG